MEAVRRPVLLLLGLLGCVEPAAIRWPEPRADERTMLIVIGRPGAANAYAYEVTANPPIAFANANTLQVTVAFLQVDLGELGWPEGPQDLVVEGGSPLLPAGQPLRVVTTELEGGTAGEWATVSEVPPALTSLRRTTPTVNLCPRLAPQPEATLLPESVEGAAVGEVAVILPRRDGIMAATGGGYRFALGADRAPVLLRGADRPADYSAGFRDVRGRSWLTGYGMFLRRLDDDDDDEVRLIESSTTTPVTPVHLDGGLVDGRAQLMAIAPYPGEGANRALGRKFFVWNEGEVGWTSYALEPPYDHCPEGLICDAWRVTWLGPNRAVLTSRREHLLSFEDGALNRWVIPGCNTYSAAVRRANGTVTVACQGNRGIDRLNDLDEAGRVVGQGLGLNRGDLPPLSTYVMFEEPPFLLLGGADGYLGLLRDQSLCVIEHVGLADLSMIQPTAGGYCLSSFKFDDNGLDMPDQGRTLRWLRLSDD